MKMIFLIMMCLLVKPSVAQDKWMVYVNKIAVLNAVEESEEKNIVRISVAELNKKNNFSLTYFENPRQKGWTRSIMVFNSDDQELKRVQGTKLSYTNSSLQNLLKKHKTIQIYTWSIPDDPALKERIRVRRVHLCTLVLE